MGKKRVKAMHPLIEDGVLRRISTAIINLFLEPRYHAPPTNADRHTADIVLLVL